MPYKKGAPMGIFLWHTVSRILLCPTKYPNQTDSIVGFCLFKKRSFKNKKINMLNYLKFKDFKYGLEKQNDGSYQLEFSRKIDWWSVGIVLFFLFLIVASSYNPAI